jgi:hypothetical protein
MPALAIASGHLRFTIDPPVPALQRTPAARSKPQARDAACQQEEHEHA